MTWGFNPDLLNLDACGFYKYYERVKKEKHRYHPIEREQVDVCKEWIKQNLRPTKVIIKRMSSYGYKHEVEKWANTYISNGAFILAMIEMGYNFEADGPNAYFNAAKIGTVAEEIKRIKEKEFAIAWLDDEENLQLKRNVTFKSQEKLEDFILENPDKTVYVSVAYYDNPAAEKPGDKWFKGADLYIYIPTLIDERKLKYLVEEFQDLGYREYTDLLGEGWIGLVFTDSELHNLSPDERMALVTEAAYNANLDPEVIDFRILRDFKWFRLVGGTNSLKGLRVEWNNLREVKV